MINQDDTNKYREVRERLISFIYGITWTLGFKLSVKGLKKKSKLGEHSSIAWSTQALQNSKFKNISIFPYFRLFLFSKTLHFVQMAKEFSFFFMQALKKPK